jgi:hypothetical protein
MTATTAKLSIMVTPAVKHRLEAEARAKKMTVGELVRRRIDGEYDSEERLFMNALADLGQRAQAVIADMDAEHASLARERDSWPAREKQLRKQALANLTPAETHNVAVALNVAEKMPA